MILNDFVFLGTTVPEQMKDGRIVRCSAGFSAELRSLLRLYPISPFGGVHRWERYVVDLERNPKDNRVESWKLRGDRSDPDTLTRELVASGRRGTLAAPDRVDSLAPFVAPSISWLNDRRMSLGVIEPVLNGYSFEYDRQADDASSQFPGMETPTAEWGRHSYCRRPRIQFSDADGAHDLSFNEHGAYEWMRNGGEPARLFDNLRFGATGRDVRLLVGNLCNHRTAWVVIAYLSSAKTAPSLFDSLEAATP